MCIIVCDKYALILIHLVHIHFLSSISINLAENLSLCGIIFFIDVNVHLNVKIWQGDAHSEPLSKKHKK
jgi:hypothetical protein